MNRLFHVSKQPGIAMFEPRPSPSYFEGLTSNVVFVVEERLLHNYLLPRDCPRIAYYTHQNTTETDREKFFSECGAEYIINIEASWYEAIRNATLYCYEFLPDGFILLDECAGYYISYHAVKPISVTIITDCMAELLKRNIEVRFIPSLLQLGESVKHSTLNFSLIRMRNAV